MTNKKLIKESFRYKKSDCTIISDKKSGIETAKISIKQNLKLLENYIKEHPRFLFSLEPVPINNKPDVVRLMGESSEKAGVGPMAAVAGVLADLAVQDMVNIGCKVAVVENGGEVAAISNQPIDIALVAGNEPLSKEMGFRLEKFPIGVATSSGKFSHAFSFGDADAVTIFAKNAGIADAAATSVANLILGNEIEKVIKKGIDRALEIEEVEGVFVLYQKNVGKAGKLPEIIRIESSE